MKWIDRYQEKKLPDYDQYVLWYSNGAMFVECLDKDGNDWLTKDITHWMPLPDAPQMDFSIENNSSCMICGNKMELNRELLVCRNCDITGKTI